MNAAVDHVWQSTLFAVCAAGLTLVVRNNRAAVRYWIWFAAALKFLLPFGAIASIALLLLPPVELPRASGVLAIDAVFQSRAPRLTSELSIVLAIIWLAGGLALLVRWSAQWRRLAGIARTAEPVTGGPVLDAMKRVERGSRECRVVIAYTSDTCEPGVIGVWRPVLLWPRHLLELRIDQIEAIVVHELAHIRRRDNLFASLYMLVHAMFWFHPVVWWIGARLADERERACDELVLESGQPPAAYASSIVDTCRLCVASPLANLPGVTGGNLKRRVSRIMTSEIGAPLGMTRRIALVLLTLPMLAPIAAACTSQRTVQVPAAQATPAVIVKPKLLREVKPEYTAGAIQRKIQGDVELQCVVRPNGKATDITVVKSLDPELDEVAVRSLEQSEFAPGTVDGKPSNVQVDITMTFRLK